jgi:hypothetical protein
MRYIIQTALAYAVAVVVALVEALVVDLEVAGATLLVSTWLLPSIAALSLIDWSRWGRSAIKHVVFLLSLLPLSVICLVAACSSPEASEMAVYLFLFYLFQAIAAYLILNLGSRRPLSG